MTLVLKPGYSFDSDSSTYIDAVETADGQALETGVRIAINDFVLGCKQDGIWNAIKASCIMAGARTLAGALVPLTGTAPTNFNFVDADYDRETGLVGDGSAKYLDSNRANDADGQNDQHMAVYQTELGTAFSGRLISGRDPSTSTGSSQISDRASAGAPNNNEAYSRYSGTPVSFARAAAPKLFGISRSSSASYTVRQAGVDTVQNFTSAAPNSTNITIFSNPGPILLTDARLSFYSIGESLDLAKLDTRVSNLMTAIGAAIP